jgi:hypothetical protein
MTTTTARRRSTPVRALKSPLAVPGVSAAAASGPHGALAPAPCHADLSEREADPGTPVSTPRHPPARNGHEAQKPARLRNVRRDRRA